jgi:hypothetical protein
MENDHLDRCIRYGFRTFSQELNSFKLYNQILIFGEKPFILPQNTLGLSASWIEVVAGIKPRF